MAYYNFSAEKFPRNTKQKKCFYNKIGLLILNEDATLFLVCEPGDAYHNKKVQQYLMPGGQLEEDSEIECLNREIKEELDCGIDMDSIKYIDTYEDAAADPGRDVMIKLYQGNLIGEPKPSSEIGALRWIGKDDINNPKVSPIIKNKIIPDLIKMGVLK